MKKAPALIFDIGASHVRAALISQEGQFLQKAKETTSKKSPRHLIEQIKRLAKEIGGCKTGFQAVVLCIASPLDCKQERAIGLPNFPFQKINLVKPLQNYFGRPVSLINDCNAAVLGEKYWGAGKKTNNLIYLTISSGIGGGAIVDGKLLLGENNSAMEAGHMTLKEDIKLKCSCGKYGHWEALCSGSKMPHFYRYWQKKQNKKQIKNLKTSEIFTLARNRDKTALSFLDEVGRLNAMAIGNLCNILAPSLVILGGAVVLNNKQMILKPIKKYLKNYIFVPVTPQIKITALSEDVTLLGGSALIFKQGDMF